MWVRNKVHHKNSSQILSSGDFVIGSLNGKTNEERQEHTFMYVKMQTPGEKTIAFLLNLTDGSTMMLPITLNESYTLMSICEQNLNFQPGVKFYKSTQLSCLIDVFEK